MSKILDKFNLNEKRLYSNPSPYSDGAGANDEPYLYYYPNDPKIKDLTKGSEQLMDPKSVSVDRDIERFKKFDKSERGKLFLDKQKRLQQLQPWGQTRAYRTDNIKDNLIPYTNKIRHGTTYSIQTLQANFDSQGYENDGRVQGETSDKLINTGGPVYIRLHSKHGMLNSKDSLIERIAVNIRGRISKKINDILAPINRVITGARARVTDTSVQDRPEIEFDYLYKIYQANKAVRFLSKNMMYGHIYMPLEVGDAASGTYIQTFAFSEGAKTYKSLDVSLADIQSLSVSRLLQQAQQKASRYINNAVSSGIKKVGSKFGLNIPPRLVSGIKNRILPAASDISLLRNLNRVAQDIDEFIGGIRNLKQSIEAPDKLEATDLASKYKDSDDEIKVDEVLFAAEKRRDEYIRDLSGYFGAANKVSLGSDGASVIPPVNSEIPPSLGYKDHTQKNPSIYKSDIDYGYDNDTVDVIFSTADVTSNSNSVRFRSFIEDFKESITPSFNENKYVGRIETFYTYQKVIRDASFSLRLIAFSKDEVEHIWNKINYLSSLAYPLDADDGYIKPTIVKLTLGKIYIRQPCIVTSITHNIEPDASWDIDSQIPNYMLVSLGLRLLDKKLYTHKGLAASDNSSFDMYFKNPLTVAGLKETINSTVINSPIPNVNAGMPNLSKPQMMELKPNQKVSDSIRASKSLDSRIFGRTFK